MLRKTNNKYFIKHTIGLETFIGKMFSSIKILYKVIQTLRDQWGIKFSLCINKVTNLGGYIFTEWAIPF